MLIIYNLYGTAGRARMPLVSKFMKGVVLMSTYEEFQIILTVALLIVAILSYTNKN